MEEKLKVRIEQAMKERVCPGCVIGVVHKAGNKKIFPFGHQTYDKNSPTITEESIFDVASMTKSVAGSSALLKLIDDGKISLDQKVFEFIPEFGNFEDKKLVTIKHILTYALDLEIDRMSVLKNLPPHEIIQKVLLAPLKSPPGLTYKYVNATALLISLIIEKVTCRKFDDFVTENFFEPLGMIHTTFHPEKFPRAEIIPTEIDEWRGGEVRGVVHDESSFALRPLGVVAVAGLFSTTPDLLVFAQMLLNNGELNGKRYFSPYTVELMHTNQFGGNEEVGLGWELNQSWFMGTKISKHTFGKTGFTGCSMVIDYEKGIGFVLLSNRIYPKRPSDSTTTSAINSVRRDIADIILGTT